MIGTDTTTIREAYDIIRGHNGRDWVRIATIQAVTGMRAEELATEIKRLMDTDPHFQAEPEPLGHRVTEDDERYAVEIGGEPRHLIAWY